MDSYGNVTEFSCTNADHKHESGELAKSVTLWGAIDTIRLQLSGCIDQETAARAEGGKGEVAKEHFR